MKFLRDHDAMANELAQIGAMIQRLERLVQRDHDPIDRAAPVAALPVYSRARGEAHTGGIATPAASLAAGE